MKFRRPSDGSANGYVGYGYTSQTTDGPLAIFDANGAGEVRLNAYANNGIVSAYTSNLERLRIDNLGDVGFGTTSPAGGLDVVTGSTQLLLGKLGNAGLMKFRRPSHGSANG